MPSLSKHQSNDYVKLLLLGDAKSGKTGSLVSLVEAGYKLRILDFDNLLDILAKLISEQCPDKLDNVEFRSLRDVSKMTSSGPVIQKATAFIEGTKMLDRWKYKDDSGDEIDLGIPSDWGPDCILVIDSLSRLCDAAYDWCMSVIPGAGTGKFDGRAVYGNAQDAVESTLALLTSDSFATNLVDIDLDLNPEPGKAGRTKTNSVHDAGVQYIVGSGFRVRTKPHAWSASCAADMIVDRDNRVHRKGKSSKK